MTMTGYDETQENFVCVFISLFGICGMFVIGSQRSDESDENDENDESDELHLARKIHKLRRFDRIFRCKCYGMVISLE